MFKALLTALAIALSGILYAASPDPAAWYRPLDEDYLPSTEWIALMYLEDSRGALHEVEYGMYIDPQTGEVINSGLQAALSDLKLSLNTVVDVLDETTMTAVENAWDIERLDAQFTALGKNLTQVFQVDGMEIVVDDKTYRLKMSKGSLREAITTGTSVKYDDVDGMLKKNDPDEKSINLSTEKLQIKGWDSEDSIHTLAVAVGDIPFRSEKGAKLEYRQWRGFDMSSIGYNSADQFEIKNWSTAKACGENLTSLLTDPVGSDVGQHLILTKAGKNLHYLPIGKGIITNSTEIVVDEKSITKITETSDSGEETTKLALMGFGDSPATEGIDASSVFPYKASNKLAWSPFLSFFSEGIFKKNSKNQISLRGLDTISEGTKIVTASGNGGEPQLGASDLKDMIDKPLAVENKKITIEGWSSNKDGNLFDASGCEVVVRDGGKMKFKTFGGIDGSSVNLTDDGQIQLKDWKTATPCSESVSKMLTNPNDPNRDTHQLLAKVGNDLHYVAMGEVIPTNAVAEVDEVSIEKTTNEEGKEVLSLYGFGNGGTETNPYIPSEIDGLLSWKSVISFFNENMFDLNEGKIIIKGLDSDDEEIRILTVKGGDNGAAITSDSMKTFIDPPLEWRDNKITVSGYDVAKEGEYLCRSKTGVEWKTVDDGILADEKSITTNSTPKAFALAGFGTATENMIPYKDASKLNWQKITDFLDTTVDNKSIVLNDSDKLAVKGAETVSSPRKYFGTGTSTSVIGWYDLPNVTTNRIDADEVTLTTHTSADGKVKTIKWKTTPPEKASLARMGGDGIEWVPFDAITNQNAIVGVDDISVATNGSGKLEIKGWSTQAACGADLIKMLTDANDSDRKSHQLLCRVNNSIHYLPFDKVLNVPKVDGDTLVEKGDGTIGLSNSYGVEDGAVPHRVAGGLEWKKVNDIIGDEETIAIDEDSEGTKTIRWLSKPDSSPSLAKITENGLEWVSIDNITNDLVSAMLTDGVTIVTNGNGEAAIKGFADQDDCSADFAQMLADPNYGDRTDHAVLCRYGKGDSATIHYLPFKDFMATHIADEETLHAKEDGKLELVGFTDADDGYVPTRSGSSLEWKKFPEIKAGNGVTVTPTDNGDYEVSATNVCECTRHDPPNADGETIIDNDGVWSVAEDFVRAESMTNAINTAISNASPQITIDGDTLIEKGDGTIGLANSYDAPEESVPTRSGDGLTWVEPTEVTFVVDVIWDEQTKTIKKKTATYKIYGTLLIEDEDYQ